MASEYRLVSYADGGAPKAGVLVDERVVPAVSLLQGAGGVDSSSVLGLLRTWERAHALLHAAAQKVQPSDGIPLAQVKLLAPILYPGALLCAGANYWDHLEEMAEIAKRVTGKAPSMAKGKDPFFFMKTTAGSIIGTGTPARLPPFSKQVDWEAELGVVIGKPTRNISEQDAFDAVAGYLIVNDLSARDLMKREGTPFGMDWIGQKCFEDAAPMGPWFTPAAYVADPNNLPIKLWVNGVLKQNSNTSRLVHNIAEQIAYLSWHFTLNPGDVIATGTPAGVGMPRGEFLKAGDEVRIEVGGCGILTNKMIAG
ncbi:MAG TPA: fumarylacetoacetate hydrolase family protein [Pseudolabrys sp.]|jgi:2-keto-4-pentenoate hydratase/2-oxohepta-3-ene-1,7-dioic acid hydratase in catechol pathway